MGEPIIQVGMYVTFDGFSEDIFMVDKIYGDNTTQIRSLTDDNYRHPHLIYLKPYFLQKHSNIHFGINGDLDIIEITFSRKTARYLVSGYYTDSTKKQPENITLGLPNIVDSFKSYNNKWI